MFKIWFFNRLCATEVTDQLGHISYIKLLDGLALLELLNNVKVHAEFLADKVTI